MKLLFTGASFCSEQTMRRLMLLGTELCFMDRPSITFGDWGFVGSHSPLRQLSTEGEPVTVQVYNPPVSETKPLYEAYIETDISNPEFVKTCLEGLQKSEDFASKFITATAQYGENLNGAQVRQALLQDRALSQPLTPEINPRLMYQVNTPEGRQTTLKTLLVEVSAQVTSTLLVADEANAMPVADDNYMNRLLALRTGTRRYVGPTPALAPFIGLEFVRAVIPDEVLQQLDFRHILDYRKKTKGLYDAWNVQVNSLAAKVNDTDPEHAEAVIKGLIATELMPQVQDYQNEMAKVRDNLFGDLLKNVAHWHVPSLSLSYLASFGFTHALATFAAATAKAAIPPVIDYVKARRVVTGKHPVSYLIGINK